MPLPGVTERTVVGAPEDRIVDARDVVKPDGAFTVRLTSSEDDPIDESMIVANMDAPGATPVKPTIAVSLKSEDEEKAPHVCNALSTFRRPPDATLPESELSASTD